MYKDLKTFEKTVYDADAIKQSIRNIILTKVGSLPGKPTFGSQIHNILFDQLDGSTKILARSYISDALRNFETRILVTDITISFDEVYQKMLISVEYNIKASELNALDQESQRFTFPYVSSL